METPAAEKTDLKRLGTLALAAIGVVYGDIGTSPLYTLKECFDPDHGIPSTPENIFGIASLVFWAIILVVTFKYVLFVMRADNRGEGGILALLALTIRATGGDRGKVGTLVGLGLFGAALFIGDGMITPAISVLSAIEGLEVGTPFFTPYVVPLTLIVLIALFAIQSHGTELVGRLFGPVMVVWFVTIASLGLIEVVGHPAILTAINPAYGVTFLFTHGWIAFVVMGSVVLAVTGGEALYADMGHFGKFPIQLAWFTLVLPALTLSYFGQSALILDNPEAAKNPFYMLVPGWGLYPMVILSTMATVIASQAVISGVFSLSRQAVQLGYSPRLDIRHTSDEEEGQIYIPRANWGLLLGIVALVVGFKSSTNLAAAYGIAVTGTMGATTILALVVARHQWKWPLWLCLTLGAVFLTVDLGFLGANLLKVTQGGWFPLAVGFGMLLLMATWRKGRDILTRRLADGALPLDMFMAQQKDSTSILRVRGTAVFMTGGTDTVPIALLHNLKHNKVLHQRIVFLTVVTEDIPRVPARDRVVVEGLAEGFYRITVRYGFFQEPDIPKVLRLCKAFGLEFEMMDTSFFLGRETLVPSTHPEMPEWRERLFVIMSRNAVSATDFFHIPAGRVVELGIQVQL
ncbi:Kup system potassium uptake protein [Paramagnetospirillum magnetotacticum MS-1]|uniref:Probable potassium transport system protein Kup n=1 Tax=Paramagnetospirillum magnetotacticum MS-1 TaxID=272627 RepID=A0A0C2YQU5_PARME|nr:potassium transporter Kup [Paramagnetospirillum magnetotacticum]KIL97055.1 Kup system potassium uptake protein [Paramagnetospirillum magnetotacticum MS-1]